MSGPSAFNRSRPLPASYSLSSAQMEQQRGDVNSGQWYNSNNTSHGYQHARPLGEMSTQGGGAISGDGIGLTGVGFKLVDELLTLPRGMR